MRTSVEDKHRLIINSTEQTAQNTYDIPDMNTDDLTNYLTTKTCYVK